MKKSSYRRVTHATTTSEVRNLVETIERTRSVVLLTPAGGDECDEASDNEEFLKALKRLLSLLVSSK